jgi:hypothetical protein
MSPGDASGAGVPAAARRAAPALRVATRYAWLENELGNGWIAACRLAQQDGRIVVSEVRVFPDAWAGPAKRPLGMWRGEYSTDLLAAGVPRGGVTSKVLRAIRLAEGQRRSNEWFPRLDETMRRYLLPNDSAPPPPPRSERAAVSGERRGRKAIPEDQLARCAGAYVQALARNDTRPLKAVADELAVAIPIARTRVFQAKQRGLIRRPPVTTGSGSGVAGGTLTPRAGVVLRRLGRGDLLKQGGPRGPRRAR